MTAPTPMLSRTRDSVAALEAGRVAWLGGNRGVGYGIDAVPAGHPFARPALSRAA